MEESFKERIKYKGEIKDISLQICKDYGLGDFKSNQIIIMGYEDFNFILETSKGKYFVKIFSDFRTLEDCKRYIEIMEKANEKGVKVPKFYKSKKEHLKIININNVELRLCVMEFINGKTIYELEKQLDNKEIKFIAHQTALINSIKLKPKLIYDEWAITNLLSEFEKKRKFLSEEDLRLIEPLIKEFKDLEIEKLPHCFVHGDITETNIMKDNKGDLWIIDFSVSNYYPRIQELAVLACNLFFDEKNKENTEKNLKTALEEYQKVISLTEKELESLPTYIKLAHTMHILNANFEKINKENNSIENE